MKLDYIFFFFSFFLKFITEAVQTVAVNTLGWVVGSICCVPNADVCEYFLAFFKIIFIFFTFHDFKT